MKIGPTYDFNLAAVQAGLDAYRFQHRSGARDHIGLYGVIGDGRTSVIDEESNFAGPGHLSAYSLGAYWTHYGPRGWYLDGVLQGTWYHVKGQSILGPAIETSGWGLAASLEAGYPFKLPGGWTIEPQAQLVYQTIGFADASDVAAQVRFDDIDSLAGRLGVRFASTWTMSAIWGMPQPALVTAWFRPSYWYDFWGDPKTLFSTATGFEPFRGNLSVEWVELNSGITIRLDRTTSLYVNASYQLDLDRRGDAWDGKIGLRINW